MTYNIRLTEEERELVQKLLILGRANLISGKLDKKVLEQLEIKIAIILPENIG